jgi:hypothetical protein
MSTMNFTTNTGDGSGTSFGNGSDYREAINSGYGCGASYGDGSLAGRGVGEGYGLGENVGGAGYGSVTACMP